MDARHLGSPAHRSHPNFQDQIHLADVLIANKRDLYTPDDLAAFERFAAGLRPAKARLACVAEGKVDRAWLDLAVDSGRHAAFPEAHAFLVDAENDDTEPAAPEDWLVIDGHADGYHHVGWSLVQRRPWPLADLQALLADLAVERMKGIVLTDEGWRTFNDGRWQPVTPPDDGRSRIQLIDRSEPPRGDMDRRLRFMDGRPVGTL
jgi:G3E family GTPase